MTGLSASTTYFFAIKTSDEIPNESVISNVPSAATASPATLLARYWMEEASSGQAPTQLLDDQASPLNLPITYDGANYSYTVLPTGRGWESTTTNNDGRASTLVNGTKLQTTLDGATATTIEVVLAIDALSTSQSRIFHIGDGSESGYLTLSSPNATTLFFYALGTTLRGQWNPGFDGTRAVFHLVYDSAEPTAGDRVRLYKNGVLQASTGGTDPPLNETISIPNGKYFAIANREVGVRSFDGSIYYAAVYDGALTASEVSTNSTALLASDDSGLDSTPPDAITDLATGTVRSTSQQLSWTAPGDDAATGTATSYDIRYSTSTITEGNWAAATQATGEPSPQVAGSSETFTVTGLSGSTTYFFAIKTSDEVPNESAISNVPSATTDLDGMTQTGFAWSDDVATFTSKGDDVTLDAAQGTTYIVGIQVAMTQGAASNSWVLQVREDGAGSWLDVFQLGGGESQVWETDSSHNFSKGNGDVVSTGEFGNGTAPTYFTAVDGEFSDDNNGLGDGYTGPDVYTELQYAVRASGLSDGHTYEFRVTYNGSPLDLYSTYATVADPGTPDAVSDLATGTLTSSSVQLTWTAPGDNGATGTASTYDVRYSTSVINDGNWASATQATGEPAPQVGGSAETFTVTGLNSSTTYYFAIKTSDEVPNESALSNVPSATTLNGAPTVVAAIADTSVVEDNPPVDNYRDLKAVFTDFEDGSALTFTIQTNTNPGLVTPTIGADSALDLSFTASLNGAATITVRATDSGALFVDDVFTVTVLDTTPPDAVADLATGTVTASSVDLSWTAPGDDGATGTATTYDVRYSTSVINDGNWASATQATGEPAPQVAGSSETFTVTGLNSTTTYYFAIKTSDEVPNESALSNVPSATTLNGPPTVAAAIADTTVNGDNPPVDNYRDLKAVFTDFEDGSALTYTIQGNTNPGLITPTIGADSALDLSFTAGINGAATITVRATDSGALFVDDVFTVTVLDTHAPEAITNLATGSVSSSSVQLTWTAPGDDGATGTATTYDVRYSTSTITEGNWASATQASGEPSPQAAGSGESFTVTGLSQGTTYHFAIKTSDEVPNQSAISNVPSVATIVSASVTYQTGDGKGSVSEADDAKLIDGGSADTNYGTTTDLEIDSGDKHSVIKFPNIFGGGADQIPLNSVIVSATLTLQVFDQGDDPLVYQLIEGWVESQVTYNDRITGVGWSNPGAGGTGSHKATADGSLPAGSTGSRSVDVSTSVQNWSDGEVNEGWVLEDTGSGGVDIRTSEYATVAQRPMLSVTYLPGGDQTAPNTVTNLATGTVTATTVDLSWTAPGDDGASGTATSYDIRYSTSTITEGNWASATQATGEPSPQVAGSAEGFTVTGLSSDITYYFAIKTSDEIPNESAISNVPSAATPDVTAPDAITDLATGTVTTSSVDLSWTAPGDDGATGTATTYDVRYSTSTINDGNWASATLATGEPAPQAAGSSESFTVTGLSASTTYFFAIKTSDEVPNESALSNVPSAATSSNIPTFASGGQKLHVGQPPVPIRLMTITDATGAGTFTDANDLRIRIPATFNMIWDTLDVDATIGGGASAKVSSTVSYEDAGKTLVPNVLTDFLASEQFTVADLSFMSFTAVSAADKLELEVYNDDVVTTEDTANKEIIVGPSISSRTNQTFMVSDPATLADTITITESPTDPVITTGDDIRIRIPTGFNMVWDATVTSVTLGGGAAGNVSTTLLPYEDGNKTAVLDVTGNFAVSDVITVVGLTFTTFSGVSAADSLELELEDDGVVSAEDDKTIEIIPLNTTPTVAAAIPDTTVAENSSPIDNYRDLNAVFTDVEDLSQLTYTIQSNTNPGLITPTIDADSALDLSFTASTTGSATITVRATDSGALFVDDVFTVSVSAPAALVGRYWLNEAPSGQVPTTVYDDQASPLNLSVTYDANMAWTLNNGHRGLTSSVVHAGIASANAAGTKYVTNLDGATQATFVTVMEWGAGNADRMAGFQESDGTRVFQLMTKSGGDIELRYRAQVEYTRMYWPGTWDDGVRRVFHAVYDSDDATLNDRVRLYVNGVDQGTPTLISGNMPPVSDGLDFGAATVELAVMNESDLSNGLPGSVFYYAVHTGEMTDGEISTEATALLADDDNITYTVAVTPDGVDTLKVLPSNGTSYSYKLTIDNTSSVIEDFGLFGFPGDVSTFLTVDSIVGPSVTAGATADSASIAGIPASTVDSAFVWYSVANVAAGTLDSLYVEARSFSSSAVADTGWVFIEVVKPNLTVGKAVTPNGTQLPGTDLTYTVTITNDGTDDAASVVVLDSVPAELDFKVGSVVNSLPVTATVEYSNDAGSSWTYVPVSAGCGAPATYDACVTHIRWTLDTHLSYVGPNNTGDVEFVARIQ